ncbi:Rv0909 family putative TA system antitoxin [Kribbella sp. NPDC026611]|uniref:Rv0909 family putative TA system antitoxin n=1 Tax=Kribbella sp. NPDC026611 TaxID=3154911 RepID=UPI003408FA29
MNDFQEQAKNWLRNVVKQNPDKIKAGVEKAGDLIDKQTGGKYADKVDAVQQKVGTFVDKQTTEDAAPEAAAGTASTNQPAGSMPDSGSGGDPAEEKPAEAVSDGPQEAAAQTGNPDESTHTGSGPGVVGGEPPAPNQESSAGSQPSNQ